MTEVVQVVCPHCRNSLRVPTAWTDQPMRCKYCQQVFQARRKAAATPVTAAAPSKPPNGAPVALAATPPPLARPGRRPLETGRSSHLQAWLVGGLVILGAGLAAFVIATLLGSALWNMFNPEAGMEPSNAVARNDFDPGPANAVEAPPEPTKPDPNKEPIPPKVPAGEDKKPNPTEPGPVVKDKGPVETKKDPAPPKNPPPEDQPQKKVKPPAVSPALKLILAELDLLPPATGGKAQPIDPGSLPAFPAAVLDAYKADYVSIRDFKDMDAKFPLRATVVRTIEALVQDNAKGPKMRSTVGGQLKDKELLVLKNQVKNEQDNVALRAAILKDLVKEMEAVGAKRRGGATKRWQVLYDFVLLRLKARVVHVVEYNFSLAQIRTDSLVPLEKDERLYRLTPQVKVNTNEAYIKQYVKDLKKGWTDLAKNHPDTPWAFLAPREQAVLLGLAWQPAKQ